MAQLELVTYGYVGSVFQVYSYMKTYEPTTSW